MRGLLLAGRRPVAALPVGEVLRVALHLFPPHVAVVGESDVGEQRVALRDGAHRVRVGLPVGARRDAEEPGLRVHRVEPAVFPEAHPCDVVTEGLDPPARDGRLQHRQVGLAAGRGERGRDVVDLLLGRDQFEDQHVLGQPALVAGHRRGDPQRVALLAQQRVAAVAGAEAPDHPLLWEVGDVLDVVARPRHVLLPRLQRGTHRVQRGYELTVGVQPLQHLRAHPGHDVHRHHDVFGVGDLHAQPRRVGVQRSHAERDHVHRATTHAAPVELRHDRLHLVGVHPVVGDPGVLLLDRADEGPLLDTRHVRGVRSRVERVRLLLQSGEGARLDEAVGHALPLLLRAVAPHHLVGCGQLGDLTHPRQQALVRGRCLVEPWDGQCGHSVASPDWAPQPGLPTGSVGLCRESFARPEDRAK